MESDDLERLPDPDASTASFLRDGGSTPGEEEDADEFAEVLEENWLTVQVFTRCQPSWLGTMKPVYAGIASAEIEAACRLLAMPPESWAEVSEGVRVMADAVAREYREHAR